MNFIAFGPLELDYYIRDNLLNSLNVGSSSLLTLANLNGNKKYISLSGKDNKKDIVLSILKNLNI